MKKIWNWVKDNWKTIVIVAAVVFTAGIATVGVGAYMSAVGSQGFLAATGSTMWAGVTATAGSMGIGGGAAGSVAASAGATGYGVGAAWGAGGGYGLGAAGKAAASKAASAAAMDSVANTAAMNVLAEGGTMAEAQAAAKVAATQAAAPGTSAATLSSQGAIAAGKETTANLLAQGYTKEQALAITSGAETGKGMSTAKALVYSQAMQTGGAALSGWAEGKAMEDAAEAGKPMAAWGVTTSERGGRTAPVEDYLFEGAVMQPLAGDTADATAAANQLTQNQAQAPLMNVVRPMAQNRPGYSAPGLDPRGGLSYTPEQMLGVGLSGPQSLMANDPRQRALLSQQNQLIGPLDNWRLRG